MKKMQEEENAKIIENIAEMLCVEYQLLSSLFFFARKLEENGAAQRRDNNYDRNNNNNPMSPQGKSGVDEDSQQKSGGIFSSLLNFLSPIEPDQDDYNSSDDDDNDSDSIGDSIGSTNNGTNDPMGTILYYLKDKNNEEKNRCNVAKCFQLSGIVRLDDELKNLCGELL